MPPRLSWYDNLSEVGCIAVSSGLVMWADLPDWRVLRRQRWSVRFQARSNRLVRDCAAVFDGQIVPVHRLLCADELASAGPGFVVDHINGNPLDNRRSNLRICSNAENVRNRRSRQSVAGLTGVRQAGNRFDARIKFDGVAYHLGTFATAVDAHLAWAVGAILLFGEFAPAHAFEAVALEKGDGVVWD